MIQQGVSTGESSETDGQGMAVIGRIMDYIEARLEAIKSREEEEDEDEEKERERERGKPAPAAGPSTRPAPAPAVPAKSKEQVRNIVFLVVSFSVYPSQQNAVAPPTPYTPPSLAPTQPTISTNAPPSPSPLPSTLHRSAAHHPSLPLPLQRTSKSRLLAAKDPAASVPFTFDAPSTAILTHPSLNLDPPSSTVETAVGSKRRHNVMMLDSFAPPATAEVASTGTGGPSTPATRRRTRSARSAAVSGAVQDQNHSADAMDVEEENGRERKRVARR